MNLGRPSATDPVRWPRVRFLNMVASGCNHDDGRVHFHCLDLEAHDLFPVQTLEELPQNIVLGPAIHADIDGVPRTGFLRQSAPLAALFGNIEQRVEKLQVGQLQYAPLTEQL